MLGENTPASFTLENGKESVFAYQQLYPSPFSLKFQQGVGQFEYSLTACKNSIGKCYSSRKKAESYIALKNS
jgi:hypothetical protein